MLCEGFTVLSVARPYKSVQNNSRVCPEYPNCAVIVAGMVTMGWGGFSKEGGRLQVAVLPYTQLLHMSTQHTSIVSSSSGHTRSIAGTASTTPFHVARMHGP
jgi:hypothetical protein